MYSWKIWGFLLVFCLSNDVDSRNNACIDRDQRCSVWSRDGKCSHVDVKKSCPKSCHVCSSISSDALLRSVTFSSKQIGFTVAMLVVLVVVGVFIGLVKVTTCGVICRSKGSLKGKVVVITGATSGIGLETAFHLASRGARLILGCRNLKKGFAVAKDLRRQTKQDFIEVKKLDLSSLESVREFAQELNVDEKRIDILINNAAVITKKKRSVTIDGLETTFQVNYLAHFLLTKLLIGKLKRSGPSRIINVVCDEFTRGRMDFANLQSEKTFSNYRAYSVSKLALMLFTQEATRVLKSTNVTVNAVNPSRCCTNLWRNCFPYKYWLTWLLLKPYTYLFWKTADMGAETIYFCSLESDIANVSGRYFKECAEVKTPQLEEEVARKLWDVSERLIKPKKMLVLNKVNGTEGGMKVAPDAARSEKGAEKKHDHQD